MSIQIGAVNVKKKYSKLSLIPVGLGNRKKQE
jgi:hypothetical protein